MKYVFMGTFGVLVLFSGVARLIEPAPPDPSNIPLAWVCDPSPARREQIDLFNELYPKGSSGSFVIDTRPRYCRARDKLRQQRTGRRRAIQKSAAPFLRFCRGVVRNGALEGGMISWMQAASAVRRIPALPGAVCPVGDRRLRTGPGDL